MWFVGGDDGCGGDNVCDSSDGDGKLLFSLAVKYHQSPPTPSLPADASHNYFAHN